MSPRLAPRRRSVTKRLAGEGGGSLVAGRAAGQLGRLPQPITAADTGGSGSSRVPQLEGSLEVVQGGARRHRLGGVGGGKQRRERRRLIPGPVKVDGELARPVGARQELRILLPQDGGDPLVQASSLRREQVRIHDLPDQRVPDPVRVALRVDHEQLRGDRRPQRSLELVLVDLGDAEQQVVVRVVSDRGNDAKDPPARVVQIRDVGGDEIRQHRRDGLTGEMRLDQFRREERVALTAHKDLVDQREGGRAAGQRLDPCRDLATGESPKVDAMHGRQAGQLTQTATLLGVRADLVGTIGANQRDRLVDQVAGQEVEQVPRQRIGPMQILEGHDRHTISWQRPDELEDRAEQPARRRRCPGGSRRIRCRPVPQRCHRRSVQRLRRRSPHVADQLHQRRQRDHLAAHRHAPPHEQVSAGTAGALGDQRRLADAGITTDQQHPRTAQPGNLDDAVERRQLTAAPDEVGR